MHYADEPAAWFSGREGELRKLLSQLSSPGSTVLLGGGTGLGKSELARVVAKRLWSAGYPVLWRDMPQESLCQQNPFAVERLERDKQSQQGLLVLDDAGQGTVVEALRPGPGWNVLVTTQEARLLPGIEPIKVGPLPEAAAKAVIIEAGDLCEPGQYAGIDEVVQAVRGLPLGLVLTGRILRSRGITPRELMAQLPQDLESGAACIRALTHLAIREFKPRTLLVLEALARAAPTGASADEIAAEIGLPEPATCIALSPIVKGALAEFSPATGLYRVPTLIQESLPLPRELLAGKTPDW